MSTDLDESIVTRTLEANGYRINVRDEGDGTPLLLINGLTRSLGSWEPFTDALRGHRVISFDAPGVGERELVFAVEHRPTRRDLRRADR